MAKILLVGTESSEKELYEQILQSAGYDAVSDSSAKDALDRLNDEFFPGCVVFLPREEALWFLIKVRASHKIKISTIPILVLADEPDRESEFIEAGATRCLVKFPASADKLASVLRSILNLPRL